MLELQFGPYSGSVAAQMTHCWFPVLCACPDTATPIVNKSLPETSGA
jgi:hypothetical protein